MRTGTLLLDRAIRTGDTGAHPAFRRGDEFADRISMPDDSGARPHAVGAFTIGVSGAGGSGRTVLLLALCRLLRDNYSIAVLTRQGAPNQDGCREFLIRHKALTSARIPVVADPRDISCAIDSLMTEFRPELVFIDCDGDTGAWLDAVADFTIHVVDGSAAAVAPDDLIDVVKSDLLVLNQTRLGPPLDVERPATVRECLGLRGDSPWVFTQARHGIGTIEVARRFLESWRRATTPAAWAADVKDRPVLAQV